MQLLFLFFEFPAALSSSVLYCSTPTSSRVYQSCECGAHASFEASHGVHQGQLAPVPVEQLASPSLLTFNEYYLLLFSPLLVLLVLSFQLSPISSPSRPQTLSHPSLNHTDPRSQQQDPLAKRNLLTAAAGHNISLANYSNATQVVRSYVSVLKPSNTFDTSIASGDTYMLMLFSAQPLNPDIRHSIHPFLVHSASARGHSTKQKDFPACHNTKKTKRFFDAPKTGIPATHPTEPIAMSWKIRTPLNLTRKNCRGQGAC